MTIEQLHSLSDDETAMLWFMVNKVFPPAIRDIEMEPSIFTSIKHGWIVQRILNLKENVKEEHKPIYESLKNKLDII